jgi:putative hemolysin
MVQAAPDGSAVILGSAPVRDVNRILGIELPEEGDWTTVAGLAVGLAGRIPPAGERLALPGGWTLEVLDASPRRVKRIRLIPPRG